MTPSSQAIAREMERHGITELQAIRRIRAREEILRMPAPMGVKHRISSDSAWPLRGTDGRTFAERAK